jgi:hypothetical protein
MIEDYDSLGSREDGKVMYAKSGEDDGTTSEEEDYTTSDEEWMWERKQKW